MKANYDHYPQQVEPLGNGSYLVNYNIEEKEEDGRKSYDCEQVTINGTPTRSAIISAIIRERYTQDNVEAITSNFLAGEKIDEYNEFQSYRELAKAIVDTIFKKYR